MNLEITKAVRSVKKEDVLGYVPEKMANLGVTEETITFDMFEDFLSLTLVGRQFYTLVHFLAPI
jgi:hypothetical protein